MGRFNQRKTMSKTTEIIKVVTEVEITYSTPIGRQHLIDALITDRVTRIDYACNWRDGSGIAEAKSLKSDVLDTTTENS